MAGQQSPIAISPDGKTIATIAAARLTLHAGDGRTPASTPRFERAPQGATVLYAGRRREPGGARRGRRLRHGLGREKGTIRTTLPIRFGEDRRWPRTVDRGVRPRPPTARRGGREACSRSTAQQTKTPTPHKRFNLATVPQRRLRCRVEPYQTRQGRSGDAARRARAPCVLSCVDQRWAARRLFGRCARGPGPRLRLEYFETPRCAHLISLACSSAARQAKAPLF